MAYGVRSHKFLCCLPVRLGVFVLSFIQLLVSGFVAAICYYTLFQRKVTFERRAYIVLIIFAVVMSILAISSVLGFFGSMFRRYRPVAIYSSMLNWMLGSKDKIMQTCINGSTDQSVINACNHIDAFRFGWIGGVVLSWIIQLYECIIVARYVIQLQEEKEESWRLSSMKSYAQIPNRTSTEALNYPSVSYPYADKENSYGNGPHV
ncbi:hypothetical protein EW145_g5622 [Phellinidium pouzarii]|uniref:Uncharacterized protein n=1 Tax=Phellinidium pouzarii TaxID=167371 RepID=A0A4S4KZK9_9AGAM|nr:hypothetical protein EW145_g5622 [Phellinidium pouzarii]